MAKGLPASPGAATGQIVFFADDAEEWASRKKKVIMVRIETSPEDLRGMSVAQGILTARGGMTSHAAVVARGMGKCCVSGAGTIKVDYKARTVEMDGKTYNEGDWISINGSTGEVYDGAVATVDPDLGGDYAAVMALAEKFSTMDVYTNADSPRDARKARELGAHGIGLCRTEHMFFEGDRIKAMREMIIAPDEATRRVALAKLLPLQRGDFEGIFEAMDGYEVTIRLLDPPLHEFVPHQLETMRELAEQTGRTLEEVKLICDGLEEFNPMLGHRGCRLGNTYPEITEMQARAIIEAALNVKAKGVDVHPKIMVPLIGVKNEIKMQANIINETAKKVFAERGETVAYKVGTMIEIPRAALVADQIAEVVDFFSFGTNDLTQMTFGYSRDDAGKFLAIYKNLGILKEDPFQVLDQEGVGQLVEMATLKGRAANPDLNVGICGEHGGEPKSVKFCNKLKLNYVSCSPYRVPIARLAAAQAAVEE
jgi:pyruvate,orthophosphate dikinase